MRISEPRARCCARHAPLGLRETCTDLVRVGLEFDLALARARPAAAISPCKCSSPWGRDRRAADAPPSSACLVARGRLAPRAPPRRLSTPSEASSAALCFCRLEAPWSACRLASAGSTVRRRQCRGAVRRQSSGPRHAPAAGVQLTNPETPPVIDPEVGRPPVSAARARPAISISSACKPSTACSGSASTASAASPSSILAGGFRLFQPAAQPAKLFSASRARSAASSRASSSRVSRSSCSAASTSAFACLVFGSREARRSSGFAAAPLAPRLIARANPRLVSALRESVEGLLRRVTAVGGQGGSASAAFQASPCDFAASTPASALRSPSGRAASSSAFSSSASAPARRRAGRARRAAGDLGLPAAVPPPAAFRARRSPPHSGRRSLGGSVEVTRPIEFVLASG